MSTEISAVIPQECISFDLAGPKEEIIQQLVQLATKQLKLAEQEGTRLFEQVLAREQSGSTGVGSVGIPHVKTELVQKSLGALAVFPDGIDFNAVDGELVYSVFLILSPTDAADEHVGILRAIANLVRSTDFIRFARQTKQPDEAWNLLQEMAG